MLLCYYLQYYVDSYMPCVHLHTHMYKHPSTVSDARVTDCKYTKQCGCCRKSQFSSCRDWKGLVFPVASTPREYIQRGVHKHTPIQTKEKENLKKHHNLPLPPSHLLFHTVWSFFLFLRKMHSICQALLALCHRSVCLTTNRFNTHPMKVSTVAPSLHPFFSLPIISICLQPPTRIWATPSLPGKSIDRHRWCCVCAKKFQLLKS